jgi:hypothetical protein
VRVVRRARRKEVAQVDDRVRLDVHHVVHAHHVTVGETVVRDVVPGHLTQVQTLGPPEIAVDVEVDLLPLAHVRIFGAGAFPDQVIRARPASE